MFKKINKNILISFEEDHNKKTSQFVKNLHSLVTIKWVLFPINLLEHYIKMKLNNCRKIRILPRTHRAVLISISN